MERLSILPIPQSVELKGGAYPLPAQPRLYADPTNQANAAVLEALIPGVLRVANPPEADIRLEIDPSLASLGGEGYSLDITPSGVAIRALSPAGCFYGLQSLRQFLSPRQLLPPQAEGGAFTGDMTLPCLSIQDKPRFFWRGLMFDEARHFFGKETVKRLLDLMALLKLNTFHWHLTDDQGWRVEIKKYPRLTEVGGRRQTTQVGGFACKEKDGRPHQGFYTQAEIREMVAYAAERHITILPEIDFPGHFSAAVAAYPELSCARQPIEVPGHFGIHTCLACGGDEHVMTFMQDVLDELVDLFPGRFIHLGGDEAKKDEWQRCPACQAKMAELGLADEMDLQVALTNQLAAHLAHHQRRALVWNEALEGDLAEAVAVAYWITSTAHTRRLRAAISQGRQVVFQPMLHAYCDWPHALVTLKNAYRLDPLAKAPPQYAHQVLGLQGALWTEFVQTWEDISFSLFPRLAALAEAGWSPLARKDFQDFLARWKLLEPRLASMGVQAAPLSIANPGWLRRLGVLRRMLKEMRVEQRLARRSSTF